MQATNRDQYLEDGSLDEYSRDSGTRHRVITVLRDWLHAPWFGYLCSLLLIGGILLLEKIDQYFPSAPLFEGAPFALVSVLVGLIWGMGPALFSIVLGLIAIADFISPGIFTLNIGRDIIVGSQYAST
ncbi:MAG TPA: hypothetical protein VHV10_20055 [Ktedonobacteraceae bacterium]|nr:hypothetical protein [Ktedonobacteraceae bacterium]